MTKKDKDNEMDIYEDDADEWQEDTQDEQEDYTDFSNENMANNAMEYASIVSTPSELSKNFKNIPKETRYAFLTEMEARELKHWDKSYRHYMYLRKVLQLQKKEDDIILKNRNKVYTIKNEQDFKKYCEINNNLVGYNAIKNDKELMAEVLEHIKDLQDTGFYSDILNQNTNVTEIYQDYRDLNKLSPYVDDLGLAGSIYASSVISMGRDGNERMAQLTTISATKDLDVKKQKQESTDYKNKIGRFFDRFKER